jgi:hypothetical protein
LGLRPLPHAFARAAQIRRQHGLHTVLLTRCWCTHPNSIQYLKTWIPNTVSHEIIVATKKVVVPQGGFSSGVQQIGSLVQCTLHLTDLLMLHKHPTTKTVFCCTPGAFITVTTVPLSVEKTLDFPNTNGNCIHSSIIEFPETAHGCFNKCRGSNLQD